MTIEDGRTPDIRRDVGGIESEQSRTSSKRKRILIEQSSEESKKEAMG